MHTMGGGGGGGGGGGAPVILVVSYGTTWLLSSSPPHSHTRSLTIAAISNQMNYDTSHGTTITCKSFCGCQW